MKNLLILCLFIVTITAANAQQSTGIAAQITTPKLYAAQQPKAPLKTNDNTQSISDPNTGIPNTFSAESNTAVRVSTNAMQSPIVFMSTHFSGSGFDLNQTSAAIIGNADGQAVGVAGFSYEGPGVYAQSNFGYGIQAISERSIGAFISNKNTSNSPALYVNGAGNSFAANIFSSHPTDKRALYTFGRLRFLGINEQAGSVLKGDAAGNATWGKILTPTAYGEIDYNGTIIKGTGNFVVNWDLVNREYTIVFSNDGSALNVPIITERTSGNYSNLYYEPTVHITNSNQFRVKKKNTSNGAGEQFAFFFVVF